MQCACIFVVPFKHLHAEALLSPFLLLCLFSSFAFSLLFICTSFVVGWVPVVSALSVTAVDGGKEQEGLVEREKQRWALATKRDVRF